jgi:hypothetical protein
MQSNGRHVDYRSLRRALMAVLLVWTPEQKEQALWVRGLSDEKG